MPLIWKDGVQIEGTVAEFVAQLRAVADRADQKFGIMSDESGLLGDFIRRAADEIERLAK